MAPFGIVLGRFMMLHGHGIVYRDSNSQTTLLSHHNFNGPERVFFTTFCDFIGPMLWWDFVGGLGLSSGPMLEHSQ